MADICDKCTRLYASRYERTLFWNDPEVGIDWPLNNAVPLLSGKDAAGVRLKDAECDNERLTAPGLKSATPR